MLATDRDDLLDYSVIHVGSSGSLDRIEGSPAYLPLRGEGILPLFPAAGKMPTGRKAGTASPRALATLSIQPIVGFQTLELDPQSEDFSLTYLGVRLNGRLSANWSLFGGFTQTTGDSVDSTLLDFGLRYAW